jgi:hypothetical protein
MCELQVNSVLIWRLRLSRADAICINQQKEKEKTLQVRLMRTIYLCGIGVLIWLGPAEQDLVYVALLIVCQLAAEKIEEIDSLQASNPQDADRPSTPGALDGMYVPQFSWYNNELSHQQTLTINREYELPSDLRRGRFLVLCPLFEAPWFQRVWIMQEYMLSNHADVFWGTASFRFDLLAKAAERVLDDYWSLFAHFTAVNGLKKCYNMYKMKQNWGGYSFYDVLLSSRDRKATDPRDRIFALVGVPKYDTGPESDFPLSPDYNLSTAEVYHITAKRLLVEQNEVDLLAYVRHDPQVHETWASWVPDWTSARIFEKSTDKKVCGYIPPVIGIPDCAICDYERYGISIRGIVVDTIHTLAADIFDRPTSKVQYGRLKLDHLRRGWLHAINAFINYYQPLFPDITLAKSLTAGFGLGLSRITPQDPEEKEKIFLAEYHLFVQYTRERKESYLDYSESTNVFVNLVSSVVAKRRFFVTSTGMLGLGPKRSREGDVVAILFGGTRPYLLRPVRNGTHWRLVGECYVHDIMNGQAAEMWLNSDEPLEDFHLY